MPRKKVTLNKKKEGKNSHREEVKRKKHRKKRCKKRILVKES